MNPSTQISSNEWAPVEHLWEDIAEAWFKPDGERSIFIFRIPQERFESADTNQPLTVERLLEAASIAPDEVESWRLGDEFDADATQPELKQALSQPSPAASHLTVYVYLKPPAQELADDEDGELEMTPEKWQAMEACWKAILGLEASIDALRLSMGGLRSEMEGAFSKSLTAEDKLHALQSDVSRWTKAKSRVHFALPKLREYVHRATWAAAAPERKALEEIVRDHIEPRIPLPQMNRVRERLEHLHKDRQLFFVQGNAVAQEGRSVLTEILGAISTLHRNAADRARKERSARREKPKYL